MNKLREARVLKKITQFQLRISTGIHQSKISLIENGFIAPKDTEKKLFSNALGVNIEDLFPTNEAHQING